MLITVMWPPELVITESMFRHYTGVAEIAGYLKENSVIVKKLSAQIDVVDCAVEVKTALNIATIARKSSLIPIYVNMNNILEAMQLARFMKGVHPELCIVFYGEAAACNPQVFSELSYVDYVIGNGQTEYALDYIICRLQGASPEQYAGLIDNDIDINGKIICVSKPLPCDLWGLPALDLLPLEQYLFLSKGELHLLINKGCPFHCEFCNERLVSSKILRYRAPEQVAEFLCASYPKAVRSVYLDASTFTYDREWVLRLRDEIQRRGSPLPLKTCTRLDCIDKELIAAMAKSGCTRISVGVETLDVKIQSRNKKSVSREALTAFANSCRTYGILPRALLIIGLDGQRFEDIKNAKSFCADCGIDGRFRVLQDYSALINCKKISELDISKLDRWNTWNPFAELPLSELREIEYPTAKGEAQNYV